MGCIKNILATAVLVLLSTLSIAQITQGKIVYERRTNLKKTMGDNPRMKDFINDDNKIRKENFELLFNDSTSVFRYIEDDEVEANGMMKYLTQRNTLYQDLGKNEFLLIMSSFGEEMYLRDSISHREWQITENKRLFAGYNCRQAIWQMNDSTRIYAWFSPDIVPSMGPEGFSGLPGAILGLATENGAIVYFASSVEEKKISSEITHIDTTKKDIYTKKALKVKLTESMSKWVKPEQIDAMFAWY